MTTQPPKTFSIGYAEFQLIEFSPASGDLSEYLSARGFEQTVYTGARDLRDGALGVRCDFYRSQGTGLLWCQPSCGVSHSQGIAGRYCTIDEWPSGRANVVMNYPGCGFNPARLGLFDTARLAIAAAEKRLLEQ